MSREKPLLKLSRPQILRFRRLAGSLDERLVGGRRSRGVVNVAARSDYRPPRLRQPGWPQRTPANARVHPLECRT